MEIKSTKPRAVEAILAERVVNMYVQERNQVVRVIPHIQHLVKWKGFRDEEISWENVETLRKF